MSIEKPEIPEKQGEKAMEEKKKKPLVAVSSRKEALGVEKEHKTQESHLLEYLARFEVEKKDNQDKFVGEFGKISDVEVLRQGSVSLKENTENIYTKHVKLSSAYLDLTKSQDGHITFNVDFKENMIAEYNVGAAHVLPPEVKAIKVYDDNGEVLFDRVERGIKGGRIGYFTEGGEYVAVHTGYKIEILETQEASNEETLIRIAKEKEHFILMGHRSEIRGKISDYLTSAIENGDKVIVDDEFIIGLADQLVEEKMDWDSREFWDSLIQKTFAEEELIVIGNLAKADYSFNLSDVKNFAKDPKLEKLKTGNLKKEQIAALLNAEEGSTIEYSSIVPKPLVAKALEAVHSRVRKKPPTHMIIHDTGSYASADRTAEYLAGDNKRGVSSHYTIGRNGRLIQTCSENRVAYHTKGYNESFGIDFANKNFIKKNGKVVGYEPYTEAQYRTGAKLIAYLSTKHDIPLSRVIGHKHTEHTDHVDPSPLFDWNKVRRMAQAEISQHKKFIAVKEKGQTGMT